MKRHIPNLITLFRCLLIIPIIIMLLEQHYHAAFYLFILAGLSDGIDGFLARAYDWRSRLGSIADPLVDKLFIISTLLVLTFIHQVPLWLLVIVLLRDVLLVAAVSFDYLRGYYYDIQPTLISKINTVIQVLFIVSIMAKLGPLNIAAWVIHTLMILMCVTTVLSYLDYSIQWFGRKNKMS